MCQIIGSVYNSALPEIDTESDRNGEFKNAFDMRVVKGEDNLLLVDNIRGNLGKSFLEGFVTGQNYTARTSYGACTPIDPRGFVLYMTTNEASLNRDTANRACFVRIKRRKNYNFRDWDGMEIQDYVRAHKEEFFSAVYSILWHYVANGCPRVGDYKETRFADFFNVTSGIAQYFGLPPTSTELSDIQGRVSSPAQTVLRLIATTAKSKGLTPFRLSASNLVDFCERNSVSLHGLSDDNPRRAPAVIQDGTNSSLAIKIGKALKDLFITPYNGSLYPATSFDMEGCRFVCETIRNDKGRDVKFYTIWDMNAPAPNFSAAKGDE